MNKEKQALKEAFPYTFPIMTIYILMGGIFGIMMANSGHSVWISLLMSLIIYAGATQYIAVALLAGDISLINIAMISLGINARQFFYAIASLNRYKLGGWRKYYLIFSVTDETFAMLNLREQKLKDKNIDDDTYEIITNLSYEDSTLKDLEQTTQYYAKKHHHISHLHSYNQKVMFYISFLNQVYWVIGCVGGTLLGESLTFLQQIQGLEFIITATFSVLLYENLKTKENYLPIFIGFFTTLVCFLIDRENFLVYSLILIVCFLLLAQRIYNKK